MSAPRWERLLLLADFLDKLPPEMFNDTEWVGENWSGNPDLMACAGTTACALMRCGTTACALGWATTIPEFRALGLELDREERRPRVVVRHDVVLTSLPDVCEVIFGIDEVVARRLFLPSRSCLPYASGSAKDAAAHIRAFVAKECE